MGAYNIRTMPTILVFIPFSRHIFRQMLAGVHRFYAGAAKVQIVEGCANAARLRHLLEFWRPKGCIVEASEGIGIFTRRNLGGVPTVYLDRASLKTPEFDVVQDYAAGSEAAARELISPAMAHYAFVGYHIATTWSHDRCKAFRAAVKLNGLPFSSFERILPEGNRTQALREWVAALPKPCGILAANDTVAEEVLAVCTNLNLHVPEDVMIVGVDNDEQICEQSDPTISSVCPDFERSGHLCAELLDARIRNPRLRPRRLMYGIVGLIRRGSSVPALKSNYRVMAAVRDIRTRACAGLRVADVVATMGCSTRLAEMRFREVTGKTIREAIADIRMERAVVLLKGGATPIGDIAQACGYGTEAALRIAFRKRFGQSMRAWRAISGRGRACGR